MKDFLNKDQRQYVEDTKKIAADRRKKKQEKIKDSIAAHGVPREAVDLIIEALKE